MMKLEIGMPVVFKKPEDRYDNSYLGYNREMDKYSSGVITHFYEESDYQECFYIDPAEDWVWHSDWIDKKATKELWAKLFKDNVKVGMTVYYIEEDGSVVTRMVTNVDYACFTVDSRWIMHFDAARKYIKLRKTLSSWGWDKLGKIIERDAGVLTDPVKKVGVFVAPKKQEEVPIKMEPMEMPSPYKVTYDGEKVYVPFKKHESFAVELSEIPEPYREKIAEQCFNVAKSAGYIWVDGDTKWNSDLWYRWNHDYVRLSDRGITIGTTKMSGNPPYKSITLQEWFKYFQENKI